MCGSQSIPWEQLSAFVRQVRRLGLQAVFRGHEEQLDHCDGLTEIRNVELVRHRHSVTQGTDLVRMARQRSCSDPRDRVYGVIGLMTDYMQESFVPEPGGESVEKLYPPFVAILLQLDPTAFLLSMTDTTQRNPNLPSWCPDLHHPSTSNLLVDYHAYHAGYSVQTSPKYKFVPGDWTTIHFKGVIADVVKSVELEGWSDTQPTTAGDDFATNAWDKNIALLQTMTSMVKDLVRRDDLWRFFVGDMVGEKAGKSHLLLGFASIYDRLLSKRSRAEAHELSVAFDKLQAWQPATGQQPSPSIQAYLQRSRRLCLGRKLFVTQGGRVGFGPRSMTAGDSVCIFKCAQVPFVLTRRASPHKTYLLRGEAYVHGLMKGEYLKIDKDFKWITLV